jgi:hypothetical protein
MLRDFLRGFTEDDVASLTAKLDHARKNTLPGEVIEVTNRELAAMGEFHRRCGAVKIVSG